jgi:hypothetical protein
MKRILLVFFAAAALFASPAFALTDADTAALKQLTKDYASWDYSGHPVGFRQRLDYKSFEEQRQILLKLAEIEWNGLWGDYWRRLGVNDIRTLRALAPKGFWVRFNSVFKPRGGTPGSAGTGRTGVDIHAITEARGYAYVVYKVTHFGRDLPSDDNFEVLRARCSDGEWRLVALPRVTADLRRQLEAVQAKKRSR